MSDWDRIWPQLMEATGETLYMVGVSALLTVLLGTPSGSC
jgi:D-methionine transport system permease protein